MATVNLARINFAGGEISPILKAREDLPHVRNGCLRLRNFVVLPQGGVHTRPGTRFVCEIKDSSKRVRLVPFTPAIDAAYVCEFGDGYVRFVAGAGRVENPPGTAVEVVSPYAEADLPDLDWAQDAETLYLVHPRYRPHVLRRTSPTSFTLEEMTFSAGREPIGATNPDQGVYISANVAGTTYARRLTFSADPVVHGRTGFDASDVDRVLYVYRYDPNANPKYRAAYYRIRQVVDARTVEVDVEWEKEAGDGANISGADSWTWAAGLFSATQGCRAATFHEGRLWFGGFEAAPDTIAGSVSGQFDVFEPASGDPDALDAENADKAIYRRALGRLANTVRWLVAVQGVLLVGTTGGEFAVTAASDGVLTPSSAVIRQRTSYGSSAVRPAHVDTAVFFVPRGGTRLYRMSYDLTQDGYAAVDISVIASHLARPGLTELAYAASPHGVLWALSDGLLVGWTVSAEQELIGAHAHPLGDGGVPESITVVPGDAAGTPGDDPLFLVVRRTVGGQTKRYIERLMPLFLPDVAYGDPLLDRQTAADRAVYLDSSLTLDDGKPVLGLEGGAVNVTGHGLSIGDRVRFRDWPSAPELDERTFLVAEVLDADSFIITALDGSAVDVSDTAADPETTAYREVTVISGLGHLEGEEVVAYADGAKQGPFTVSAGSITLDTPASIVTVGLGYRSELETTPLVGAELSGPGRGGPVRISRVRAEVFATAAALWGRGPNPSKLEEMHFRTGGDYTDRGPPFYTGTTELDLRGSWDEPPTVYVRQDDPLPVTILAIYPRTHAGER